MVYRFEGPSATAIIVKRLAARVKAQELTMWNFGFAMWPERGKNGGVLHVVLMNPEIPHNTGAAGRLCLATGARLHLVKPLGFSLDDRQVKRVGLDYWQDVDLKVWENWEELEASVTDQGARMYFLTTKTSGPHWEMSFQDGDYLVFGCETKGLPESLLSKHPDTCLTIPMKEGSTRSLNLSTAVGIVLYEAIRQVGLG